MKTLQTLIGRTTLTVACLIGLVPASTLAQIDDLGCHTLLTAKECRMFTERYMELSEAERPAFRATYAALVQEREFRCQCSGATVQHTEAADAKASKAAYGAPRTAQARRAWR
jgi:hypothetical protein